LVPQAYAELLSEAFKEHGVLLSEAEVVLLKRMPVEKTPEIQEMLQVSEEQLARDLELQFGTLSEAEEAKHQAEQAKDESEALNERLKLLNAQLEERNTNIEAKLAQEKELRIAQGKTDFQKDLSTRMIYLIALALLLPYVFALFKPLGQELSSSTYNLTLLLINGLMIAVGAIFNRTQKEKESE